MLNYTCAYNLLLASEDLSLRIQEAKNRTIWDPLHHLGRNRLLRNLPWSRSLFQKCRILRMCSDKLPDEYVPSPIYMYLVITLTNTYHERKYDDNIANCASCA